jgi:L-ascorbate metabolism protein UlaG (beta-lactamase superfamily)
MIKINADVTLLPIDGKFAMSADDALKAVEIIKPNLTIPIHWGSVAGTREDADKFVNGCKEFGIEAKILEKEI